MPLSLSGCWCVPFPNTMLDSVSNVARLSSFQPTGDQVYSRHTTGFWWIFYWPWEMKPGLLMSDRASNEQGVFLCYERSVSLCFQDHIPVPYQPDSSSNPSSTTSSTPSSPAPPLPPSATPPSPLHPSPQSARQQKQSNLTGTKPKHKIILYFLIHSCSDVMIHLDRSHWI